MIACGCASPDCAVNGCAIVRRYLTPRAVPFEVVPLTEQQRVRQIIREELRGALQAAPLPDAGAGRGRVLFILSGMNPESPESMTLDRMQP